jgi:hypothetical protein
MEDYQQRVIKEKEELDEKLEKLHKFIMSDIFNKIQTEQKGLLIRQRRVMDEYSAILKERIELFKSNENKLS